MHQNSIENIDKIFEKFGFHISEEEKYFENLLESNINWFVLESKFDIKNLRFSFCCVGGFFVYFISYSKCSYRS